MSEHDLKALRAELDEADTHLLAAFEKRMLISGKIALVKKESGTAVRDPLREGKVILNRMEQVSPVTARYIPLLYSRLMELSRFHQQETVKPVNRDNVILVGMPGCGKSTVGKILAEQLGYRFWDTDLEIERKTGMPIPDIFTEMGENEFRNLETEAVRSACSGSGRVIATGGGAVKSELNRRLIRERGFVVQLLRNIEMLPVRDGRPLSSRREKLNELWIERSSLYAECAHVCIPNESSPDECAVRIVELYRD